MKSRRSSAHDAAAQPWKLEWMNSRHSAPAREKVAMTANYLGKGYLKAANAPRKLGALLS
jgi:hypothetical protein